MTARCREGHDSTELDYCSVCGAPMPAPARPPAGSRPTVTQARAPLAGAPTVCPSCGEARADMDARFCEVCRFDFVANKPGPPPTGKAVVIAAPVAVPVVPPAPASATPNRGWELVVRVDPSLDTEPDPASPCPTGVPDEIIPLDRDVLVGRRDDLRDIRPEIPVSDPGASRRHAKFVLDVDGRPAFQDLASTNGTKLNDVDTRPGSLTMLNDGDSVTLGRWTRITIRVRP